jgi:glycylpeptide N-tetradecanoyltransferase
MSHQKFWINQPVAHTTQQLTNVNTPTIITKPDINNINQIPIQLPENYYWYNLNINNDEDITNLYKLLQKNYVEDNSCSLRLNYSKELLKWSLGLSKSEYLVAVRYNKNSNPFVGFISAIPSTIVLSSVTYNIVEINFLCVHKNLREKRLAPVLIKEITRRVNIDNIFHAIYTSGIITSLPFASCVYYHRALNVKKLFETDFLPLGHKMTLANTIKYYRLPKIVNNIGLRPLLKKDCFSAYELLNNYLKKFELHVHFSLEEFEHWFLQDDNIMVCYVLENNGMITDMFSFYVLETTVLDNVKYNCINAVYSWYNIATTITLNSLINDALIVAYNKGFDVYNCVDILDNNTFFDKQKFKAGNGNLNYYMFNMFLKGMKSNDIGLVLV